MRAIFRACPQMSQFDSATLTLCLLMSPASFAGGFDECDAASKGFADRAVAQARAGVAGLCAGRAAGLDRGRT